MGHSLCVCVNVQHTYCVIVRMNVETAWLQIVNQLQHNTNFMRISPQVPGWHQPLRMHIYFMCKARWSSKRNEECTPDLHTVCPHWKHASTHYSKTHTHQVTSITTLVRGAVAQKTGGTSTSEGWVWLDEVRVVALQAFLALAGAWAVGWFLMAQHV